MTCISQCIVNYLESIGIQYQTQSKNLNDEKILPVPYYTRKLDGRPQRTLTPTTAFDWYMCKRIVE
jgi:hypothetical protein